jgi:hypothetical protein
VTPDADAVSHVVERISSAGWEQREIYAKFGLAIYFCQCLESQLVNYLALAARANAGVPMTLEEVDSLFERLFSGTLGRNIRELRSMVGDEWMAANELAPALELRNELVHHWLRDRALQQGTSHSRLAMIEELDTAARSCRRRMPG